MTASFHEIPIEDLCVKVTSGATPLRSRSDYYIGGGIDWYKTGELHDWYLDPAEERITPRALAETSVKIFPSNTVLMAMYGDGRTITSLGILRKSAATNQACSAMIVDQTKCNHSYFFYALKARRHVLLKVAYGGAQRNLNSKLIREFRLPIPSLVEQQTIAGILSAYDELIENNQRRIRTLEKLIRALYREWFVLFRFPDHENTKFVSSPLGEIPEDWEVVSVDDVCECVTDGSHSSPSSVDEGLPMASSKDLHDWGLNLETCRSIGREDFDQLVRNGCKPKKNDVLITKDGANYLKYILVNKAEQELVLLSSIAILRPNTRINPHLLAAILKSPENKNRLKNYVTGAAIPRIVLKDFKRFQFVLPCKTVQTQWSMIAEPMTELCWRLVDEIQNLRRTRDVLLPRLISGEISIGSTEEPETKTISFPSQLAKRPKSKASDEFVEAVVIAQLARKLGTTQFPLGRLRYNKLAYLAHRKAEDDVTQHYLKKAAGPYSPWAKYQGPEKIAIKNGYVTRIKAGVREGLVPGSSIGKIDQYLSCSVEKLALRASA